MARARKQRSGKAAPPVPAANARDRFELLADLPLPELQRRHAAASASVRELRQRAIEAHGTPEWWEAKEALHQAAGEAEILALTINRRFRRANAAPPAANAPANPSPAMERTRAHLSAAGLALDEAQEEATHGRLSPRLTHAIWSAQSAQRDAWNATFASENVAPSSPNDPAPSNPKIDAAAFLHDAGAMLTAASGFQSAVWAGDEQTARDLWQGMMDRVDGMIDRLGRTGPTTDTYAERGLDPGVAALRNLAYELRALARHPTGDVPESWIAAIWKIVRDMRAQLLQLVAVAPYVTKPNPDGSTARLHVTEAAAHLREALHAIEGAELDEGNPAKWSRVHRLVYEWPGGHRRTIRVDATRLTVRKARRTLDPLVAPSGGRFVGTGNPSEFTVPQPPYTAPTPPAAEPNPRALVQIGLARELQLDTRTGWKWSIADGWRVLVPAGAEQLAPGAGRIFIVPPPSSTSSAPPEPSAAAATFAEWHGFDPRRVYAHDVPRCEEFGAPVGGALRIVYRSDKWDRKPIDYDHSFKASEPPAVSILGTAEAPRAILVRGGVFRTTARGLVD
jgi:hypothetical protein